MLYVKTRYHGPVYLLSSPWQGIPEAVGTLGKTGTNEKHVLIIKLLSTKRKEWCGILLTATEHGSSQTQATTTASFQSMIRAALYTANETVNSPDLNGGASLALAPRI